MNVIFSAHAKSELREIALYIARGNKLRAQSFVRELRRKAEDLARDPLVFPATNAQMRHVRHEGSTATI